MESGELGLRKLSSSCQIVLASNCLRVKSSCTLGLLGQMSTLGIWVYGTNGQVGTGTNGHLGKQAFGGKWALWDR